MAFAGLAAFAVSTTIGCQAPGKADSAVAGGTAVKTISSDPKQAHAGESLTPPLAARCRGLTPAAMPAHPFMLFGQSEINDVAARKEKDPLLDECWMRLSNRAAEPDNMQRWWDQLEARAFVGKVTRDPEMIASALDLMAKALAQADPYDFYGGKTDFHFHAGPLRSLALAWDWLYNDMTPQQRAALLPGLEKWCDACYTYNNKQWWREAAYNVGAIPIGGLGILALSIYPDSTHPDADLWLNEATRRLSQNFYPISWKPSGICWEGPNYAIVGLKYPAMFSEALRRAGGPDQFGESGAMHALQYLMYQWMPQEGCAPIGDNTNYGRRTFAAEYLLGAARTEDATGLWTWRNYTDMRRLDELVTYLWYPTDVKPVSPAEADMPTSKYFEVTQNRAGYFFGRTAWEDPDAAFFAFVTRYEMANHQHYDMNSFLLGGFGTLFATHELLFPYGHEHHAVDFEHNMVIINEGGWARHDHHGSCGDSVSTQGTLVGLATGPLADYVRGDAKWSYRDNSIIIDNPAIRAERTCLFVKAGETPYMFAFDDQQFSHDEHTYRWQWHAPLDVPLEGTGSMVDPIVMTGKNGTCALQFIAPAAPEVTIAVAENAKKGRWNHDLRRITATQKGIRVRFAAIATMQGKQTARPTVAAKPVTCRSDSAGAADVRLPDGQVDHLAWQSEETGEQCGLPLKTGDLETDGLLAMVRVKDGRVTGYVLGEGTYLKWDGKVLVQATGSVCVTADGNGAKVFGRRRAREGLSAVEPKNVKTVTPAR